MSDQGDPKAFVLLRYPGAEAYLVTGRGWRIVYCHGTPAQCILGGWCVNEENAWKSAARRLGWREK